VNGNLVHLTHDSRPDLPDPGLARLLEKAIAHDLANETESALEIYLEIVRRGYDYESLPPVPLANALERIGTLMAGAGQLAVAIRYFDNLVELFADRGDGLSAVLASAFYNRGVAKRELSQVDEALGDFDTISTRFANDPDVDVRRYLAMALHSKATILSEQARSANDPAQYLLALDTFGTIISQFDTDIDSAIQLRVANSMFEIASALRGNGNAEGARSLLGTLVLRFGGSAEPGFENVLYKSCHQILSTLGSVKREPSRFEQYLQNSSAPHAKTILDVLQHPIREIERRHGDAIEVLREFYKTGAPFALYLRNFAKEASFDLFPIEDSAEALPVVNWSDDPIEGLLATTLATRVPVICVVNNESLKPRVPTDVLPKLHVPTAMWQSVVLALIHASSAIIVNLDDVTAGIENELRMIKSQNRQDACVVVLSTRDDLLNDALKAFKGTYDLSELTETKLPTMSSIAAQLNEFKHTFRIDELETNPLEEIPTLRQLIEEVELRRMGATPATPPSATQEEKT
jgi:tetratricopeptide (TPR) repeat protein